jgi:hypothetical protein
MPYVRRDATGRIVAVSLEPLPGFDTRAVEGGEIAEFGEALVDARGRLQETDLDVVRVLDDLVNLLVDKNVIRFTDLPEAAQSKLIARRGLRETGRSLGLLGDEPRVI